MDDKNGLAVKRTAKVLQNCQYWKDPDTAHSAKWMRYLEILYFKLPSKSTKGVLLKKNCPENDLWCARIGLYIILS